MSAEPTLGIRPDGGLFAARRRMAPMDPGLVAAFGKLLAIGAR